MIPEWQEWYKERERMTYDYKLPKLNVTKNDFFDTSSTGVEQEYDHDSVHKVVAIMDRPAYTFYQPDNEEVNCSKSMFNECPEFVKQLGVVEESMALALERSLIPFPGGKTPEEAFLFALMKVCTSITSGWFREYAYNSYDDVVDIFNFLQSKECYTKKFQQAIDNGIVKLKENQ